MFKKNREGRTVVSSGEDAMRWHWFFSRVLTIIIAAVSFVLGIVLLIFAKKFGFDGAKFYYVVGGCYAIILAFYPLFVRPTLLGCGKRSGLFVSMQFVIFAAYFLLFGPQILDSIVINGMKLINSRLVSLAIMAAWLIVAALNFLYYRRKKEMFTL